MYHAKVSVVLSECANQAEADAELELAMQSIGFTRSAKHWVGKTELTANSLLGVVSDCILAHLRRSGATVWIDSFIPLPC
jgi:hypothetical protein